MISRSVRDRSASTRSTARNVNAGNVSLLGSNAAWMAGERTRSRNRITVVASGRLWVGARFCHSKRCAILIASMITRSELMGDKRTPNSGVPRHTNSSVFDALDFDIYTAANLAGQRLARVFRGLSYTSLAILTKPHDQPQRIV